MEKFVPYFQLSINEETLKLKLHIRDIKEQFLHVLMDYEEMERLDRRSDVTHDQVSDDEETGICSDVIQD